LAVEKQKLIFKGKVLRDNQQISELVNENDEEISFHLVAIPLPRNNENLENNSETNNSNTNSNNTNTNNTNRMPNFGTNIFMQPIPMNLNGLDIGSVNNYFILFLACFKCYEFIWKSKK
jgi:hypothetical protein